MSRREPAPSFEQATEQQRAGRYALAAELYRKLLEREPDHDRALYLLAGLELEAGQVQAAIAKLQHALRLVPEHPAYLSNLGLAYRRAGMLEQATETLYRAVQLGPRLAEAAYNLGLVLRDRSDWQAALLCFVRAADLKPDAFAIQQALARTLIQCGQLERAVGHLQAALALQPQSIDAGVDLMSTLEALRRNAGVEAIGQRVLALDARVPAAHRILGIVQQREGRLDEAVASFQRALAIDPDDVEAHYNLGYAWMRVGRIEEAVAAFRRAIAADPRDAAAHSALVVALAFHPDSSARDLTAEAQAWARRHAEPLYESALPCERDRSPERRLRVGYVSADLYDHSVRFYMLPLLGQHDTSRFETFCYSSVLRPDAWTERMRDVASNWRDVSTLSDGALADQIRRDEIDVLVDLSLHTPRHRLTVFARKPAPVQLSWLGYPGATGLRSIDFHLTDPYLEPPGAGPEPAFDAPLRLADTFWCFDPLSDEAVGPLPALTRGHVTFGNLNDLCKINARVLALWARVMAEVEGSRLLLLAPPGSARERVRQELGSAGIAAERVDFIERLERGDYLRAYHGIDVGLDCFPYNGHTTSLDSLWMGVPVVTLIGSTPGGRAGYAHACNLGVTDLVASSPDEFVRIAVAACRDLAALSERRQTLRPRLRASPLMDMPRFARALEQAYRTAWRRWCATAGVG